MSLPKKLQEYLEDNFKSKIIRLVPVGGGSISHSSVFLLESGEKYFLKWNTDAPTGFFSAEIRGLKELRKTNVIKIPEVIDCGEGNSGVSPFIVLEVLTPGNKSTQSEKELGNKLAELHRVTSEYFGFEDDNFIGSLVQKNDNSSNWGEFFFNNRILPQVELGQASGWFGYPFQQALEKSAEKIISILNECEEAPTLLHGDLWNGNVFWSDQGPALIDPAIYYGNREADIAMTEMFGGFSSAFYNSYNEAFPLPAEYQTRKKILNLYHQMTHSNLFGGHYVQEVFNCLSKI